MLKKELEKFLVRYNFSVLEEYEKYSKGKEYSFVCNKCGKIKKMEIFFFDTDGTPPSSLYATFKRGDTVR